MQQPSDPVELSPDFLTPEEITDGLDYTSWVSDLVRRHRAMLARVARAEGLGADDAIDAVQDAFATFVQKPEWRSLDRNGPDAERLLVTIVRNAARNLRRRSHRKDASVDDVVEAALIDRSRKALDDTLIEAEAHVRVSGCVASLKQLQKQVVTARFFEEVPGEEVAATLGLTPGNVAVILHRAKESIRLCLTASRRRLGMPESFTGP